MCKNTQAAAGSGNRPRFDVIGGMRLGLGEELAAEKEKQIKGRVGSEYL